MTYNWFTLGPEFTKRLKFRDEVDQIVKAA
jgi:hypothetical protein